MTKKMRALDLSFPLKAFCLLSTIGFALYGSSLANAFLLDDEEQIVNNRLTESFSYLSEIFKGASTGEGGAFNSYGVYFRPLMLALFMLLRVTFGLTPLAYHTFQLIVHIGSAFFLALILARFFSKGLALIGALVFLIHPMNVEAVSYIACLQDPLCALFSLAGMWLALRARVLDARTLGGLFLIALAALFSKETAILYFFATVLAALLFRERKRDGAVVFGVLLTAAAGYFAIRAGVAGLTALAHDSTQLARAPLGVRLLTLPAILASYLAKFFVPWRLATTQDWVVRSPDFENFFLPLAFVVSVTALCLWYLLTRRHRRFAFFFLWAMAGLGFHSHLLAVLDGTVAERWFYMPCMGMIGMLLTVADANLEWLARRRIFAGAALAGALLAYSARTVARTRDWSDGYTLFTTDIVYQADSAHLQNNVGVELFRRGRIGEAKSYFERSIELNPTWKISWNNLGAVYHRGGQLDRAEECYHKSMQYGPYLLAYRGLAGALLQQGRTAEAQAFLVSALKAFPGDSELLQLADRVRSQR